jgi:hypothetical protein
MQSVSTFRAAMTVAVSLTLLAILSRLVQPNQKKNSMISAPKFNVVQMLFAILASVFALQDLKETIQTIRRLDVQLFQNARTTLIAATTKSASLDKMDWLDVAWTPVAEHLADPTHSVLLITITWHVFAMTDFQGTQQTSRRVASQRKNAKLTQIAQKVWSVKSTSMDVEPALIHAKLCLAQIQKNVPLLAAVHSAHVRKATLKTNFPEFAKLLPVARVMPNVDQVKSAEREPLVLEPVSMCATPSSAQPTQSALPTITKDSASVMLVSLDLQTAELVVYLPSRVVPMMPSVKKMKCAE